MSRLSASHVRKPNRCFTGYCVGKKPPNSSCKQQWHFIQWLIFGGKGSIYLKREKKTYLQQVQSKFVILWVRPVALSHVNICNASLTFSFSWTKMSKCSVALCLAFFSEPTTTPESIIVRRRQHRKHLHRGSAECLIMMAKSQCTMETQRARGCCLKVDTRKISSLQGTRAGNCLFSPSFFS